MIRLSSSLTLGIALFFPVCWFVFFGSLTLFILATDPEDLPITHVGTFKLVLLTCYVMFAFLIYKVPMKLKRVELETDQLFVTNYFKTINFEFQQISKINAKPIFGLALVTLILDYKSFFGKKIRFITDEEKCKFLIDKYNLKKSIGV